jgi:hypothetical protein
MVKCLIFFLLLYFVRQFRTLQCTKSSIHKQNSSLESLVICLLSLEPLQIFLCFQEDLIFISVYVAWDITLEILFWATNNHLYNSRTVIMEIRLFY